MSGSTVIEVKTASKTYPFVIGPAAREELTAFLAQCGVTPETAIFIITDQNVIETDYPQELKARLESAGYTVYLAVAAAGDASKSLATAEQLYRTMLQMHIRRSDVVMAVGGGMVGDLAGFVAATYLRGIRFIQVPTTLLAHDSSIGGKVGVNLAEGKNLVGAFHQPILVLYDTSVLSTLPSREWTGGLSELIKHAVIGDPALFHDLLSQPASDYPGPERTAELVARAARVKIQIVEQDEQESGLRMLLNVGHTVGHAIEQKSDYSIHHGEAVAMGLIVEAELAVNKGWLSSSDRDLIIQALCLHGLPTGRPDQPISPILEIMNLDKKHQRQSWTFAVPFGIGDVRVVRDVSREDVIRAWEATNIWREGGVE
ncbi:3-dehydroquinate synthase [Alicyclobacillus ferrooxydans]|uniref:3-dehydroquinate synthase n=1 Tax=Alicyclobacillus ferrooxydans TaxID=471514 RepID=A0A0N8PPP2_9BACL|nr:3-dehydroquinate synthase [Alicyclobacillus ferrooxydans]KPV44877.1 hypothetical protein AN477_05175 [Alicyclobacillus ferrooxydans]